jgi:hypothetical protein
MTPQEAKDKLDEFFNLAPGVPITYVRTPRQRLSTLQLITVIGSYLTLILQIAILVVLVTRR